MGKSWVYGRSAGPRFQPPPWEPDAIDRELLASAAAKRKAGKQLNRAEAALVRKAAAVKEELDRWKFYQNIPQKHWAKMSGRQWKVLREQAELYGIPFADAVIDLTRVVPAIHDFFAKHFRKFATPGNPEDELLEGCSQKLKDEYIREQTLYKRVQREELEKKLVPLDKLSAALVMMGNSVRRGIEILQRMPGGDEAAAVMNEVLIEFERQLETMASEDSDARQPGNEATRQGGSDG